jgi:hypothetical protein
VELLVRHSFMGFGAANMASMLATKTAWGAAALAAGGTLFLPIAAAAALGMTHMVHRRSKVESVRRQLTEHTVKAVGRLRSDVVGRADAAAIELRPALAQAVRDYLRDREAQLTKVIREANAAERTAPTERAKQAQGIDRQRKAVAAIRAELESLLVREASARSAPPDRSVPPRSVSSSVW